MSISPESWASRNRQKASVSQLAGKELKLATYTPPPYFPQSSLAPPDKNRYLKFKLVVAAVIILLVLVLVGIGWGVWHLVKTAL